MKAHIKHNLHLRFLPVLLLPSTLLVLAQSGGGFDLSWSTTDGGGGSSVGGVFSLTGTAGQPDAGVMSGGEFTLRGGFWKGGAASPLPGFELFLPLIKK